MVIICFKMLVTDYYVPYNVPEVIFLAQRPSNPLALAVLALLSERPAHPYEMSVTMKNRHWHTSIKLNYGSLYTVIEGLEKRGYIRVQETIRDGNRPERTVYALTDAGRTELAAWLSDILRIPKKEYLNFEAGLTLMLHLPPETAAQMLQERLEHLSSEIDNLKTQLQVLTERFHLERALILEGEYGIAMREAELNWVRSIVTDLQSGQLHWNTLFEHSDEN
jgi:DNA-binding PadR family transcriptional regulator